MYIKWKTSLFNIVKRISHVLYSAQCADTYLVYLAYKNTVYTPSDISVFMKKSMLEKEDILRENVRSSTFDFDPSFTDNLHYISTWNLLQSTSDLFGINIKKLIMTIQNKTLPPKS